MRAKFFGKPFTKPRGDAPLGAGDALGPYTLVRPIGEGAAAVVYEGQDTRIGRRVAVKVLNHAPGRGKDWYEREIARFQREARAIGSLSHPNIVTIYDIGEQRGENFIVMELLTGVTLRERLDSGPIPLPEASAILTQVADALDAIHGRDIVHRDIKPSNVMLVPDPAAPYSEHVKLLDFGVARFSEDATMTNAGTLIGSPAYMSPEQVWGEAATSRSDVWALGVLLYEMLSGQQPFTAPQITSVLYLIHHAVPAALTGEAASAADVVSRALAKRPEDRYASAGDFAAALRRVAFADGGLSAPSSESFPASASSVLQTSAAPVSARAAAGGGSGVRTLLVAAATIIAAIVLLTATMWFAGHTGASPPPRPGAVVALKPSTKAMPPSAAPRPSIATATPTPPTPRPLPTRTSNATVVEIQPAPHPAVTASARSAATPALLIPAAGPSPSTAPTPKPSATPHPKPSPTATPDRPQRETHGTDSLVGTWTGTIHNRPVTVAIDQADAESFSGTASVTAEGGVARYAIAGNIRRNDKGETSVSFQALRRLGGEGGRNIDFGQQSGHLIDDKTLAGLGKDDHSLYSWSLTR